MARLITVSIDCQDEAARHTFEEFVSRRRGYLVTKGRGTGAADMLLLQLDEVRPQQAFGHIRSLLTTTPNLEIFLTASRTDPQILLEAFRLGVKEFLPQPLTRQDLEAALMRFEERFKGREPIGDSEAGTVVSIIGAGGGVGASTVATNLAISVRQARQRESVVLADMNVYGGELGLFLDAQADRGVKHLSEDVSRLDETIVGSALVRHESGVDFLASGYQGFEETKAAPGSVMRVINLLRSMHRHVVLDCGHVLDSSVKEALECSDHVFVVTALSLPTIRRTTRLLDALRNEHLAEGKVRVIVNRYAEDQRELLSEAKSLLNVEFAGLIPNDYHTASEALHHGKPLTMMAAKTSLAQWYLKGADRLIAPPSAKNVGKVSQFKQKVESLLTRGFSILRPDSRRNPSVI